MALAAAGGHDTWRNGMRINQDGLVSASKDELMAIWLFDDDLFRLFDFSKFVLWCKIVGVKVNG